MLVAGHDRCDLAHWCEGPPSQNGTGNETADTQLAGLYGVDPGNDENNRRALRD